MIVQPTSELLQLRSVGCVNRVCDMHFVQITESLTTRGVTSKVEALLADEATAMQESLRNSGLLFERRRPDCIEAETGGVNILNILGGLEYKVYGQSMTIEETGIGGRTVLGQIIVWTMGK